MQTMTSEMKAANMDPVNEALRKEVLGQRSNPELMVQPLIELTKFIHASWLFNNKMYESKLVLKSLCLSLSSYPANSDGSWYNFSGHLAIEWQSIEVINHSKTDMDKTEMCLLTFAQRKDSTLDTIIKILASLRRYDALTSVTSDIETLVAIIHSPRGKQDWDPASRQVYDNVETNQDDSGVYSLAGDEDVDRIIRTKFWKKLYLTLPITLQEIENIKNSFTTAQPPSPYIPQVTSEDYQQAVPIPATKKRSIKRKTIFLTFTNDGKEAAQRIATKLRTATPEREAYGVLILDENERILRRNPERSILALFNKIDFVMPILTKGYLQALKRTSIDPECTNALTSLDERYVGFIFTLMCNEFSDNCYYNDKFHCIIPDGVSHSDISKKLRGQLVLRSWANEKDIESFARKLL